MVELKNGEIIVKKKDLVKIKRDIQSLLAVRDEIQKARNVHSLYLEMKRIEEMKFDQNIIGDFSNQVNDLKTQIDKLLGKGM